VNGKAHRNAFPQWNEQLGEARADWWLTSTEGQASDKSHVLDALGKAASEIRNELGESLSTVQKFDTPLEQATTSSLEALQSYSLGRVLADKTDFEGAIPYLQRAVSLDPNFALAYATLATCYSITGNSSEARNNAGRAFELRERVSVQERYYIESHYYQIGIRDLEKARQVYDSGRSPIRATAGHSET